MLKKPITLEVEFTNRLSAELLAYLSIVERIDARTIRFVGKDIIEVSDFLDFITTYNSNL